VNFEGLEMIPVKIVPSNLGLLSKNIRKFPRPRSALLLFLRNN
jgi:hypothetical protein